MITININAKQERDDKRQAVFFTIKRSDQLYGFSHGSVPASLKTDTKIKAWLSAQGEKLWLVVMQKVYPDKDFKAFSIENKTELEAFDEWIANENPDKSDFISNHPEWVKIDKDIDGIGNVSDVKKILKTMARRLS